MTDWVFAIVGGLAVGFGILFLIIIISSLVRGLQPLARVTRKVGRLGKKLDRVQKQNTIARIKFESLRAMHEKLENVR